MTGGQSGFDPLVVAGVAGGVGTSTWVRLWRAAHREALRAEITDAGHYTNGRVDVLVSSNTAASTSRIGSTLNAVHHSARLKGRYQPPPVLVVMHTVAGWVDTLKAHLITVEPHLTAILHIGHKKDWLAMPQPPGDVLPQHKDIAAALAAIPQAITAMYSAPVTPAPLAPQPATAHPLQVSQGPQTPFPARHLDPRLVGGHPAIRAGPWSPSAPVNGARHNAMPGGRHG